MGIVYSCKRWLEWYLIGKPPPPHPPPTPPPPFFFTENIVTTALSGLDIFGRFSALVLQRRHILWLPVCFPFCERYTLTIFRRENSEDPDKPVHLCLWEQTQRAWRLYNVASTSMQRQDAVSTLMRRCLNVACPLGVLFLFRVRKAQTILCLLKVYIYPIKQRVNAVSTCQCCFRTEFHEYTCMS